MNDNIVIEVDLVLEEETVNEIRHHGFDVAKHRHLSGDAIITAIIISVLSVTTEKIISRIIDKIEKSSAGKFTLIHDGKTYNNLNAKEAKRIISAINSTKEK
jgi:hydrogenase maturation factor